MPSDSEDRNAIAEYGSELLRSGLDTECDPVCPPSGPFAASSHAGPSLNSSSRITADDEEEISNDADPTGLPSGSDVPASKKNKKKKPKGKAKNTLVPTTDDSINARQPQVGTFLEPESHRALVDKLRLESGDWMADRIAAMENQEFSKIISAIRLLEVLGKKTGATGKNKKDMADHKFWATQPVRRLDEDDSNFEEGEIEPSRPEDEIRKTPLTLPDGYEWCTLDLSNEAQLHELYDLLTLNYVEDDDAMFRFDYTAPFIEWALRPPDFVQDWHVAVRVTSGKRRLIAFIAGVPMSLQVRSVRKDCAEINFLCIHKKLRSKRLAPVLIKEITRRCHLKGIFQAIYTAGIFLPTPISRCQYFHRNLNPAKLIATGFSPQPRGVSIARLKRMYECPHEPQLPGFREIEERDVNAVGSLLRRYMSRFDLFPIMTDDEVRHNFISGKGKGPIVNGRRSEQVTWSFVVENPDSHLITDFVSFYHLPSTAMKFTPHQTIDAAYLFYYATTAAFTASRLGNSPETPAKLAGASSEYAKGSAFSEQHDWSRETPEQRQILQKRLISLIGDALTVAQAAKFDVFNALTLMDNSLFVKQLQFGAGDGYLHYYLYNWKVHQIRGGVFGDPVVDLPPKVTLSENQNAQIGSGIGVVML
ncbi:hypothetical protein O181_010582 [Austropuccinia psidii MF-1]|uniref:Glycylpeptide N-tetradecanoyltransferase n=1 Tax=Austropuccinia psidii MF-1 TaxID=1389203 RepID=A0A9Q3BU04_9BASI|nr:hypothetical protein [Austropuccinia psidii MF-1]